MTSSTISLHPPYALPPVSRRSFAPGPGASGDGEAIALSGEPMLPFVPPAVRDGERSAMVWVEASAPDIALAARVTADEEAVQETADAMAARVVADPISVQQTADAMAEVSGPEVLADPESPLGADTPLVPGLHPTPLTSAVIEAPIDASASETTRDGMVHHVEDQDDALPSISDYLMQGALPEADETAARWPIADVGAEVASLTEGLPVAGSSVAGSAAERPEPTGAATDDATDSSAGPDASMAPWSDDEAWLDIMPAASPSVERELEAQTAWARAFAEPPAPVPTPATPSGNVFAAARALEEVARRLRAGELTLPAWSPDGGDAAALAATLTALLGGRR